MNTKAKSSEYIKFLLVSKVKLLILFPLILIFTSNFFAPLFAMSGICYNFADTK